VKGPAPPFPRGHGGCSAGSSTRPLAVRPAHCGGCQPGCHQHPASSQRATVSAWVNSSAWGGSSGFHSAARERATGAASTSPGHTNSTPSFQPLLSLHLSSRWADPGWHWLLMSRKPQGCSGVTPAAPGIRLASASLLCVMCTSQCQAKCKPCQAVFSTHALPTNRPLPTAGMAPTSVRAWAPGHVRPPGSWRAWLKAAAGQEACLVQRMRPRAQCSCQGGAPGAPRPAAHEGGGGQEVAVRDGTSTRLRP